MTSMNGISFFSLTQRVLFGKVFTIPWTLLRKNAVGGDSACAYRCYSFVLDDVALDRNECFRLQVMG